MGGRGSSSGSAGGKRVANPAKNKSGPVIGSGSSYLENIQRIAKQKNEQYKKIRDEAKRLLKDMKKNNAPYKMIKETERLIHETRPIKTFNDPRLL